MAQTSRRLLPVTLAVAAAALSGAACQRGTIGGDSPDASDAGPATALNLTGRWAMFVWEDPVAVDITEMDGGVLQGQGCCGGFADVSSQLQCCGAVTGTIADRHAQFGFSFGHGEYQYMTDVYVSSDRQRMAGTFGSGFPVAWVRIGPMDANLPFNSDGFRDLTDAHTGDYELLLSDDPTPGTDFAAQRTYAFAIGGGYVWGDLGAFWSHEIRWNDADQTIVAGPVPETAPGVPVSLTLHFAGDGGTVLTSVEAVMASGVRYPFQAMLRQ